MIVELAPILGFIPLLPRNRVDRLNDRTRHSLPPSIGQRQYPQISDRAVAPQIHTSCANKSVAVEASEHRSLVQLDPSILTVLLGSRVVEYVEGGAIGIGQLARCLCRVGR